MKVVTEKIIPEYCYLYGNKNKISRIDEEFIIDEFVINLTKENKINEIIITKGNHPNCDQKTRKFNLPKNIKNKRFDENLLRYIINYMKTIRVHIVYNISSGIFEFNRT